MNQSSPSPSPANAVPSGSADAPAPPIAAHAPAPVRRRGQRLFNVGLGAIILTLAGYTFTADVADPLHLYLGLLIIILSVIPGLRWARQANFSLPLFEAFMLTSINTYAIPLLSGHQALKNFSTETLTLAALGVILFQGVAIFTYISVRARVQRTPFWREAIVNENISYKLGYGIAITTAYTFADNFTSLIPGQLAGPLRAFAYGIGIVATFLQCRLWGAGILPKSEKNFFLVLTTTQIILSWSSLFLVGGVSVIVLGLLGYVTGGKKIPVLFLVVSLPCIAVLHNGKSAMRGKYWEQQAPMPTLAAVPAFFQEWISYGLDPEIQAQRNDSNRLLERTSLFHIMCLVVANTPAQQPFLNGTTYAQIPGQFVPRFFWPEKPVGHISTYTLAIYYGLQVEEDTTKTTIGFGLLTEAYANFGFFGLAILGVFIGAGSKYVSVSAASSPLLSYGGILMVVLMAWSFQTEMTMSIWLSSLFQGCVAVLGLLYVTRHYLK